MLLPPMQDVVVNECQPSVTVEVGLSYHSSSLFPSAARMLHLQGIRAVSTSQENQKPDERKLNMGLACVTCVDFFLRAG